MKLRGYGRNEIKERVMSSLADVGLADRKDRNARDLSSGESQRLVIARALVIEPDVLLLDEPTASLDVESTRIIERIISIQKQKGRITILVTHHMNQARRLADIVVFMYGDRVIESAGTEEFFRSPSSEVAGRFVNGDIY